MASYFDDFLDMGDTQPIKVDDLPDAFESLAELSGLPSGVVANALTSAVKGQNATPPLPEPIVDPAIAMTSALANLQPGTRLSDLTGDEGFAIRSLLARDTPNFDVFTRVGENPPFDLDPVRERTREIAEEQALQNYIDQATGTFQPINPTTGQLVGPPVPNPVPTPDAPQYTFGMGSMSPPEPSPYEYLGIPALASAIAPIFGGYKEPEYKQVFVPNLTGRLNPYDTLVNGVLGQYVDVPTGVGVPSIGTPPPPGAMEDAAARGSAPRINIEDAFDRARFDASTTGNQFGMTGLDTRRAPTTSQLAGMQPSQVAPFQTQAGITALDTAPRVTPTTDTTAPITEKDVDESKPVDDDTGAEGIVQNGGVAEDDASTISFPPRSQSRRGQYFTSGTSVYVYHPFYQDNDGYKYVGETAYTDSDGVQQPSTVNNNDVNADLRRADSNLQDAIANNEMDALGNKLFSTQQPSPDVPSAQPSAPGATSQFPIAPSFQPTINQFGQPVVQATGQPMQEVMRAPATYGEVLGGTPMQPMTTTGGFYDDLYQQSLSPVEAFKAYQLSQFPGASLGSRLAAQDALGTGFDPAFGRFLLGSASGRIAPTFETVDGSSGFGRYLRDKQRADLSQVRQEFANLGAALRGYTPGGALDPRFASYYETFGDPSDPSGLRGSVLRAAQAALGTRQRTGALGNIYDVMQQQYGAGAGSRFADFVGGAFSQQPMMQSFAQNMSSTVPVRSASYSLAPPTLPGLPAYDPYNPINRLGATTAASARVAPLVTPNYQPMSGFGIPLTNQQYADIY